MWLKNEVPFAQEQLAADWSLLGLALVSSLWTSIPLDSLFYPVFIAVRQPLALGHGDGKDTSYSDQSRAPRSHRSIRVTFGHAFFLPSARNGHVPRDGRKSNSPNEFPTAKLNTGPPGRALLCGGRQVQLFSSWAGSVSREPPGEEGKPLTSALSRHLCFPGTRLVLRIKATRVPLPFRLRGRWC